MDQATRSDMIDLIMQWRFPKRKLLKNAIANAMINVGAGCKKPHSSTYSYVEQSEEYKRELLTKSSEELAELHQQALAEQEREDQARLDKLASFANDASASADFSRWGRAAYWTSAEATSLSLGKDPRVVNWQAFVSRRAAGSTLAGQYHDRHFLLQRALPQESDRPLIYIEWGKKLGIEFPPELHRRRRSAAPRPRRRRMRYPHREACACRALREIDCARRIADPLELAEPEKPSAAEPLRLRQHHRPR